MSVTAQDATPGATEAEDLGPAILFFNEAESEMVEAITARILPGTPDDPGAREAGVVYYIDRKLPTLQDALLAFETAYNTERPHQALAYRSLRQHLDHLRVSHVSN